MLEQIDLDLLVLSRERGNRPLPEISAGDLELAHLSGSVGIVVARPLPCDDGSGAPRYEIVTGEKNWLLAQRAGHSRIPVLVRPELSDEETKDLIRLSRQWEEGQGNAIDEALRLSAMLDTIPKRNISLLAGLLGSSRSAVSHKLRLLSLCDEVKEMVQEGKLKEGHVRPLIGLNHVDQVDLAETIVRHRLKVREVEKRVRVLKQGKAKPVFDEEQSAAQIEKSPDVIRLEGQISEILGCQAVMEEGKLVINSYGDYDILDGILERLGVEVG